MKMKMLAPMEVGICCQDVQALTVFYTRILGFSPVGTIEVAAGKSMQTGLTHAGYRVVRLQTPWGERIKLVQPVAKPAPRMDEPDILSRAGTAYLTFIVDDLQPLLAVLRNEGVELVTGEQKVEVRPGVYLVFARDPEGNILEFVEYADIGTYRPDHAGTKRG